MITIKSYTDLEQSRKLAEILPLESADMVYHSVENEYGSGAFVAISKVITNGSENDDFYINDIPCWSLAALLSVLPKGVKSPFGEINPFVGQVGIEDYRCVYLDGDWDSNIQTFANNPVDACYEMILKLNEQHLL